MATKKEKEAVYDLLDQAISADAMESLCTSGQQLLLKLADEFNYKRAEELKNEYEVSANVYITFPATLLSTDAGFDLDINVTQIALDIDGEEHIFDQDDVTLDINVTDVWLK